MKKKLENVIWYKCPNCFEENSIEITHTDLHTGFGCVKCEREWVLMDLYSHYGFPFPEDKLNDLACRFICDCGKSNVIFIIKKTITDEKISEDMNKRTEGGPQPKFGLCEHCGKGYDLY